MTWSLGLGSIHWVQDLSSVDPPKLLVTAGIWFAYAAAMILRLFGPAGFATPGLGLRGAVRRGPGFPSRGQRQPPSRASGRAGGRPPRHERPGSHAFSARGDPPHRPARTARETGAGRRQAGRTSSGPAVARRPARIRRAQHLQPRRDLRGGHRPGHRGPPPGLVLRDEPDGSGALRADPPAFARASRRCSIFSK